MTRFLSVDDVNRLHDLTISRHGGSAGIRDSALLDAAVAMPMQSFGGQYLHEGIAAMAAAYLYHICQAHAYVDGNKRTAALASLVFLTVNDTGPLPSPVELERVTMAVARGETSKGKLVEWFVASLDPGPETS
ncbi:MAG: type II toxin-antitoxin system death-on-curing family toxin [Gammaproteobacteria bacterium]|nr:type II toxin-antitoxin system death-on-curing family toxin [Gammaproteobacteria bacterium]